MRPRTVPPRVPSETPNLSEEQSLVARGFRRIAGIDEAGRGSWAGPLVAAAVCLPPPEADLMRFLEGVTDSKQLSASRRAALYHRILECALDVGLGVVSSATIDCIGLARSGELAMAWAVDDLSGSPDCLLIDAFTLRGCPLPQRAIIRGDSRSLSIAAASIVAKVTRDRLMDAADRVYPGYRFGLNKGYGTEAHRKALRERGPCQYHRRTYGPIRALEGTLL